MDLAAAGLDARPGPRPLQGLVFLPQLPEVEVKVHLGQVERRLDHEPAASLPVHEVTDLGQEHLEPRVAPVVESYREHPDGALHPVGRVGERLDLLAELCGEL